MPNHKAQEAMTKQQDNQLPFATKDGYWNGDMLHDWLEGEPPSNKTARKLWRTLWAYRKQDYEDGLREGKRIARMQKAGWVRKSGFKPKGGGDG